MAILLNYFVPLIPDSAPIVVHVNQYDYDDPSYAGRLVFNLIYQGTTYDLTGATASIQGTKPDGKAFAYDCTVDGSAVRAKLTQQMTAVYGRTTASIIVMDADDNRIGSFAVWLEVQQSAIDGSAPASETEIPTLIALATTQAQLAQQAAESAEASANAAAAWSANPPYIGLNGNWFVYNKNTELYEDSGVDATGQDGNLWYAGTAISGKSSTPTAFPSSGITFANKGDMYLNKTEGAIYECTTAGAPATALWMWDITLTGGGGGTDDYTTLANKPQINGITLSGNKTGADLGLASSTDIPDELADLTGDVLITSPTNNQALVYDGTASKWKNQAIPGGGGPEMVDNNPEATLISTIENATDQNTKYVSAYGIQRWSNCDSIEILTTASQGDDGVGTWLDDASWESGTRSGGLWHEALYQVLEDGSGNRVTDIEVIPVFDVGDSETVSLYSYRIDDDYPRTIDGVSHNGGCVAFKFNGEIQAAGGVIVGVKLVHQRTEVFNGTRLT